MSSRGWTEQSIRDTVDNPFTTRSAIDRTDNDLPATAYYGSKVSGDYVVVNNATGNVVQIGKANDPTWKPDASIENPFPSSELVPGEPGPYYNPEDPFPYEDPIDFFFPLD